MKMLFSVSVVVSAVALTSLVCQEAAAQQYPQPGQAGQGYAQPYPGNGPAMQGAMSAQDQAESRVQANLAKLSPEDQQLAKAQGFCAIMTNNRLGAMGTPIKLMLKGEPVFVCCQGCQKKALANPDKTLATTVALRAKVAEADINASLSKLSPQDRQLAEAQGYCPVMMDNRLGVMGPPVKVMIKGQPVFLCCAGCQRKALANPDETLARVAKLQAMVRSGPTAR